MDKDCLKLYHAIELAYAKEEVRSDPVLAKALLSASNELIKFQNVFSSAYHLKKELLHYTLDKQAALPRPIINLQQILETI
ncbi:bacteriocin immunity protein [Streptococcus sp. H49]|uniref:bacteriocin immunity protein n=1 Tax=Streptococcus huangxiaojuni TaxID=3237239 RepID=UPI0034A34CD2